MALCYLVIDHSLIHSKTGKGAEGVAQLVEYLASMCEVLASVPSAT